MKFQTYSPDQVELLPPSVREVLNEGNARLFKAGDASELIKAISNILNTDIDRRVNKAFEDVKKYSWKKRAVRILEELGA